MHKLIYTLKYIAGFHLENSSKEEGGGNIQGYRNVHVSKQFPRGGGGGVGAKFQQEEGANPLPLNETLHSLVYYTNMYIVTCTCMCYIIMYTTNR